MNLELHCIKQKTSAFIRAYIGYYPIIPTNKKLLLKMTSVSVVKIEPYSLFIWNIAILIFIYITSLC